MFTPIVRTFLLLITKAVCTLVNLYLFYKSYTFYRATDNNRMRSLWRLLGVAIACMIFVQVAWALKLIDKLLNPIAITTFTKISAFFLRLGWLTSITGSFTSILFFDQLSSKDLKITPRHQIAGLLNLLAAVCVPAFAIFFAHDAGPLNTLGQYIYKTNVWYNLIFNTLAFIVIIQRIRSNTLPRIVTQQLKNLMTYFLMPNFLISTMVMLPTALSAAQKISIDLYPLLICNDVYYVIALVFCIRRILCFRFLNIQRHVYASAHSYAFTEQFKDITHQLNNSRTARDIEHATSLFFSRAFKIPYECVELYVRPRTETHLRSDYPVLSSIETWLKDPSNLDLQRYIASRSGVIIRDELNFDAFYDVEPHHTPLLNLLDKANADVLVFVYEHNAVVGYITLQTNARPHTLFSNVERDAMCVFANNIGPILYFLQHRTFSELLRQERAWDADVYNKQQEVNHYKECVKTLLARTGHRTTGIIQYQRRKLTWASDMARSVLHVERGKPIETSDHAAELKRLAQEALHNKRERQIVIQDRERRPIHCAALPCDDDEQSVILLYHPDVADTFSVPFDRLNDISSWNYALLLETTASGALINELIPSSAQAFLNFKIDLLKVALSKKATLLEIPHDDQIQIAQIIHHISLRTKFHLLELIQPERDAEISLQLFGADPLIHKDAPEALLKALHNTGTLVIQNVEFLSLGTQQRLATCMTTGMFHPLSRDTLQPSNVRIICATSNNLEQLVEHKKFSRELLETLRTTALTLPSLSQVPHQDIVDLVHHLSEQTVRSKELLSLIGLSNREAEALAQQAPASMLELKGHVQHTLQAKSQRKQVDHMAPLATDDDLPQVLPPDVAHAIKLGKNALKDRRLMCLLWEAFKSQAKIALLLKVNRSSVNRRLKEFNLAFELDEDENQGEVHP